MKLLLLLLISLADCVWENLSSHGCYHCSRYREEKANFSSQAFVNNFLLVGAKDKIIRLDFTNKKSDQFPDLISATNDVEVCLSGGRSMDDCANYYKVIIPIDNTTVLFCGTSAYNPHCDFRFVSDLRFSKRQDVVTGEGVCPADPTVSVTYSVLSGGVGFTGTCRLSCTEFAISRVNLQAGSLAATARTYTSQEVLSFAEFVYSFSEGDFVYFLFSETAIEQEREYVYTRIGRLCKNDVGSSSPFFKYFFKTFLKVRLYCTSNTPGQTPFDHNEIGGAFYMDRVLYATFSGPKNLHTGSVVCQYTLKEIDDAYKGDYFVYNFDIDKWKTQSNTDPLQCSMHPTITEARDIVFLKTPLSSNSPIYVSSKRLVGLTGRTLTVLNTLFFEIFTSTIDGDVQRISYAKNSQNVFSQAYTVASSRISSLLLQGDILYAMSTDSVTMIPPHFECSAPKTCQECIAHHYPQCGWCYGESGWSCSENERCQTNWISPLQQCEHIPRFNIKPRNETLREGESVIFKCASANNKHFFWSREGGSLPKKSKVMENNYLLIPILHPEDSGCYRCNMNNTSGAVYSQGCLLVQVPPSFPSEGRPQGVTIQQGYANLVIPCFGSGSPPPEVRWDRLGGSLPEGSVVTETGSLKLIRVMSIDAGKYRCTLSNTLGSVDVVVALHVEGPTDNIPNGTEEQLNGTHINKHTLITLVVAIVLSAVFCFITGFSIRACYNYRKRIKRRSRYRDTDDHVALDQLPAMTLPTMQQQFNWASVSSDETVTPRTPLTPHPIDMILEEMEDEAPPAYSEHPHIAVIPPQNSNYHLLTTHREFSPFRDETRVSPFQPVVIHSVSTQDSGYDEMPQIPPREPITAHQSSHMTHVNQSEDTMVSDQSSDVSE